MSTPIRIQLKRTKGWRLASPNGLPVVVVARPSKWGNEHKVGRDGTAAECVDKYLADLEGRIWSEPNKRTVKAELRGKNLACWCPLWTCDKCGKPAYTASVTKLIGHGCLCGGICRRTPCHADVLLKIANA